MDVSKSLSQFVWNHVQGGSALKQGLAWAFWETEQFLRYSSAIVSLSAVACSVAGIVWMGLPIDPVILTLIFLGTFALYTCDRLSDYDNESDWKNAPGRTKWVISHVTWLQGMVLSSILFSLRLLIERPQASIMYVLLFTVASLYSVKFLPGKKAIRQLPGTKALFVGLCYGIACVGLPSITAESADLRLAFWAAWCLTWLTASQVNQNDIVDIEGIAPMSTSRIAPTVPQMELPCP
eukprot:jgi/Botrbrau1/21032/Bobra.0144s0044.2